jgi:hypothetical protein
MSPSRDLPDWNDDDPPPWRERTLLTGASLATVLVAAALIRVLEALWR